MGNPIQEYDLTPPTDKDRFLGIDWETGKTRTFQYEEIKAGIPSSNNSFTDITWTDLVALSTREPGQKWNITTVNPDDNIAYGQVLLLTAETFRYLHASGPLNGFIETVTIN